MQFSELLGSPFSRAYWGKSLVFGILSKLVYVPSTTWWSRHVVVIYADRGLVHKGQPNLTLFNHLHWLVFFIFTLICYVAFPFANQVEGNFPENTIKGQICMNLEFPMERTNLKQRMITLICPLIMTITNIKFKISLSQFIKGRNLNMRSFAQFGGKNPRNIMSLDQTFKYFMRVIAFIIMDNILILLFQIFRNQINPETRFVLHNILWISFMNFYISVYVPLKHIILSKETSLWTDKEVVTPSNFYLREQELVPRRDYEESIKTKNKFSYLSTKQRRDQVSQEVVKSNSLASGTKYIQVNEYKKHLSDHQINLWK